MAGSKDNGLKSLAAALNGLLADYFALYLKSKNFHWHVSGPHFREYHLLFDDQVTELLATTDLGHKRINLRIEIHALWLNLSYTKNWMSPTKNEEVKRREVWREIPVPHRGEPSIGSLGLTSLSAFRRQPRQLV
jgi:hypothetical protein